MALLVSGWVPLKDRWNALAAGTPRRFEQQWVTERGKDFCAPGMKFRSEDQAEQNLLASRAEVVRRWRAPTQILAWPESQSVQTGVPDLPPPTTPLWVAVTPGFKSLKVR